MNLEKFFNKYLSKKQRDTANRLSVRWKKIVNTDDELGDDDEYYIRTKLSDLISPACNRFAKDFFRKGEPSDDEQYLFGRGIDIILQKWDEGWVPSVRTNYWDAPSSTIDEGCAVDTATDALSWGLCDALTYQILNKGAK